MVSHGTVDVWEPREPRRLAGPIKTGYLNTDAEFSEDDMRIENAGLGR